MIEQIGTGIVFTAFFSESKLGKTGLTVTVDVYRGAALIVEAAAATEIGGGLYRYALASGSVTVEECYCAIFKTATTSVDQRAIPALWTVGVAGIETLDAAISTRTATEPPSAADIADAVLDEVLEDHDTEGTAGAALGAAAAAGDPWETELPGDYAEGTAGELIGKLGPATPESPTPVPAPPDDASLCTVYLYTEALDNTKRAVVQVTFRLSATPATSERGLETRTITATSDADGLLSVTLQRTDALEPAGLKYVVNSRALGLVDAELELEAATYDLRLLMGATS